MKINMKELKLLNDLEISLLKPYAAKEWSNNGHVTRDHSHIKI